MMQFPCFQYIYLGLAVNELIADKMQNVLFSCWIYKILKNIPLTNYIELFSLMVYFLKAMQSKIIWIKLITRKIINHKFKYF